tara:strand:+ start:1066 stop:1470 length:405 start_codon:yes stop_codon:yes gene_type:complete
MEKKINLHLIKLSDIGLLGIYYTLGALLMITIFNKFFKLIFDSEKIKLKDVNTSILIFQISLEAAACGILAYILRRLIRNIPFPFDGVQGYNHFQTKEINGGVLIAFSVITVFSDFKDRINELVSRIDKTKLNI